jgi:hypothetical protein
LCEKEEKAEKTRVCSSSELELILREGDNFDETLSCLREDLGLRKKRYRGIL